jgi:2-dehydro-3-deoxygalactonokinase
MITPVSDAAFALVDWGTTHLRLWLTDRAGHVLAEHSTAQGMAALQPDQFAGILEQILSSLGAPGHVPVVMCGMVGSRQGWREVAYASCPAALADLAAHSASFQAGRHPIRILPGIARKDTVRPDVMRGEETQLLGLSLSRKITGGLVCLPGTHSKWVKLEQGAVVDFATIMTGELYALLRRHSILRHSTGGADVEATVSAADPVFLHHVATGLSSSGGLGGLFAIRAASLLAGTTPAQSRAALSGLLIGTEIRDASALLQQTAGRIHIIGSNALAQLYHAALSMAGFVPQIEDGPALVRAGLLSAATQSQTTAIRAAE